MAQKVETAFARIRGLRIRYRIVSNIARDVPLLICNGIGQSLESLAPFYLSFTDRDVILYDAPGSGESTHPLRPITFSYHASVLADLLDHLGVNTVDVLGVSWGGGTAQRLACARPDLCRKLVLAVTCAGGLFYFPASLGVALEMAIPTRYLSKRRRLKAIQMIYGGDVLKDPAPIQELYQRNRTPSMAGYFSQLVTARLSTSLHWLHRIKQPTLILSGDEDPLIPPIHQRILHTLIPNAQIRLYDCGHLLLITRQAAVVEDLQEFLG